MNKFKKAVLAATVAIAGFSTGAHAALMGSNITLDDGSSKPTAQINEKSEFSNIAGYLDFDFSADQLIVTISQDLPKKFSFPSDLGSFVFSGFNDQISSFTMIKNAPQFQNFDAKSYSFNATSITLDFAGVTPSNEQARLIFGINMPSSGGNGNNVPEPATVALLGLGLLGVAAARRKAGKRVGV